MAAITAATCLTTLGLLLCAATPRAEPVQYRAADGNWQIKYQDHRADSGRLEVLYQSLPTRDQRDKDRLAPALMLMRWVPGAREAETREIFRASGLESDIWQSEAVLAGDLVAWHVRGQLQFRTRDGALRQRVTLAERPTDVGGIDGAVDEEVVVVTRYRGPGAGSGAGLTLRRLNARGQSVWRADYREPGVNHILQGLLATDDGGALFVTQGRDASGRALPDQDSNPGDQVVRRMTRLVRLSADGDLAWQSTLAVNKSPAEGVAFDPELLQMESVDLLRFAESDDGTYLLFERSSSRDERDGHFLRRLDEPATASADVSLARVEETLDINQIHGFAAGPEGEVAITGILRTKREPRGAGFLAVLSAEGDLRRAHLIDDAPVHRLTSVASVGGTYAVAGLTGKVPLQFVLEDLGPDDPIYLEPQRMQARAAAEAERRAQRRRLRDELQEQAMSTVAGRLGMDPKSFASMDPDQREAALRQQAQSMQEQADARMQAVFGMSRAELGALGPEEAQRLFSELDPEQRRALMRQAPGRDMETAPKMQALVERLERHARGEDPDSDDPSPRPEGVAAWTIPGPSGGVFEMANPGDGALTFELLHAPSEETLMEKTLAPGADVYEFLDLSRIEGRSGDLRILIRDQDGSVLKRFRPEVP